jgi:F-type H+-transporting ATPase subunit delta
MSSSNISILGRRYANALLSLAIEAGNVDKISQDLSDFADSWNGSRDLRAAFENPVVGVDARRKVLREIAEQSGMDPLLRNTLLLLSDRGRISRVNEVAEAFKTVSEARSGRVRAEVITASELPEAYFTELQKTLERVTGKQVSVSKRVDPSLLAGVVTRVGDQVFDGSLKNRLEELKHELSR